MRDQEKNNQASNARDYNFLIEQRAELRRLIDRTGADEVIVLASFEHRLQDVESELAAYAGPQTAPDTTRATETLETPETQPPTHSKEPDSMRERPNPANREVQTDPNAGTEVQPGPGYPTSWTADPPPDDPTEWTLLLDPARQRATEPWGLHYRLSWTGAPGPAAARKGLKEAVNRTLRRGGEYLILTAGPDQPGMQAELPDAEALQAPDQYRFKLLEPDEDGLLHDDYDDRTPLAKLNCPTCIERIIEKRTGEREQWFNQSPGPAAVAYHTQRVAQAWQRLAEAERQLQVTFDQKAVREGKERQYQDPTADHPDAFGPATQLAGRRGRTRLPGPHPTVEEYME